MANYVSQHVCKTRRGNVVLTEVELTSSSAENVTLPRMPATTTGTAVQVVRPGDTAATLSISSRTVVSVTGSAGDKVLLASFSTDPIPNPISG